MTTRRNFLKGLLAGIPATIILSKEKFDLKKFIINKVEDDTISLSPSVEPVEDNSKTENNNSFSISDSSSISASPSEEADEDN